VTISHLRRRALWGCENQGTHGEADPLGALSDLWRGHPGALRAEYGRPAHRVTPRPETFRSRGRGNEARQTITGGEPLGQFCASRLSRPTLPALATVRRERPCICVRIVVVRFDLFAPGRWVIGANMRSKFFVALQLEVAHHLIERCAGRSARRVESPVTFGATKAPKMHLINPYQTLAHGCVCRLAPALSDRKPSNSLPSRDDAFSFRSSMLPDCQRKPSSRSGVTESA
jgi:hypothetical protein